MSDYVVMKLVSGETVIAQLLNETNEGVHVINPLQVKMIPVAYKDGDYGEQAISSRLCQFTDDVDFTFNHKDLIYCKPLKPKMEVIYTRLIKSFDEETKEILEEPSESVLDDIFNGMLNNKKIH